MPFVDDCCHFLGLLAPTITAIPSDCCHFPRLPPTSIITVIPSDCYPSPMIDAIPCDCLHRRRLRHSLPLLPFPTNTVDDCCHFPFPAIAAIVDDCCHFLRLL